MQAAVGRGIPCLAGILAGSFLGAGARIRSIQGAAMSGRSEVPGRIEAAGASQSGYSSAPP